MKPVLPTLQLSGEPGPAEQQARYFQLMRQGLNNNDASRAVGFAGRPAPAGGLAVTKRRIKHPFLISRRTGQHDRHFRAVPVRTRTRLNRRSASRRPHHSRHRRGAGPRRIDDQPGAPPQRRPGQQQVPPTHRQPDRGDSAASAEDDQDRRRSSTPRVRRRVPGQRYRPDTGADQPRVDRRVPHLPSTPTRGGDALPGDLPATTQRPDQHRPDESAYRTAAASPAAVSAAPTRAPGARSDDRRPPGGGQKPSAGQVIWRAI